MGFIFRSHTGRLSFFTIRSAQECHISKGIYKQPVSCRRNVERNRCMTFPGICHGIGIHLNITSSAGLIKSLKLKSEAIDILPGFHWQGYRNSSFCLLPMNLILCNSTAPAHGNLFYLFFFYRKLPKVLRCILFRCSKSNFLNSLCYLLHLISSCARHNAPMIPGFSPNAGATIYCDISFGRTISGR